MPATGVRMKCERLTAPGLPRQAGVPGDRAPVDPAEPMIVQPGQDGLPSEQGAQRFSSAARTDDREQLLEEHPRVGRIQRARSTAGHLLPALGHVGRPGHAGLDRRPGLEIASGRLQAGACPEAHEQAVAGIATEQSPDRPPDRDAFLDAGRPQRRLEDVVVIDARDALIGPVRRSVPVPQRVPADAALAALLEIQPAPLGRGQEVADPGPSALPRASRAHLRGGPLPAGLALTAAGSGRTTAAVLAQGARTHGSHPTTRARGLQPQTAVCYGDRAC